VNEPRQARDRDAGTEPRPAGELAVAEDPRAAAEGGGSDELAWAQPRGADRRPLIERVGLFAISLVMALLFGGVALALLSGGELFLGFMATIGAGMTLWVGGLTLLRG
jgi:hypothetical protein